MKDDSGGGGGGSASRGYNELSTAVSQCASFLKDFDFAIREYEKLGFLTLKQATKTRLGSLNLYPIQLVQSVMIGSSSTVSDAAEVMGILDQDYKGRVDQLASKLNGDIDLHWKGYAQEAFVKNTNALIGHLGANQLNLAKKCEDAKTYGKAVSAFVDKLQADLAKALLTIVRSNAEAVKNAIDIIRDWTSFIIDYSTRTALASALAGTLLAAMQMLCSTIIAAANILEKLVDLIVTMKEGERNLGGQQYAITTVLHPKMPSSVDHNRDGISDDLLPFSDENKWHYRDE